MQQFRLFQGKSGRFFVENEAHREPNICLQMARAYLTAADPVMKDRTWQTVMDQVGEAKRGSTLKRWIMACKDPAFDLIRDLKLTETRAEQFWKVLKMGTVSTNTFLRRLHNFAVDMNWILAPIIPRRQWPQIHFKEKRAITLEEHLRIVEREKNPERKLFYELAWHLGASQSDLANLHAEDIDWPSRTITFERMKLRHRMAAPAQIRFGKEVEGILSQVTTHRPALPVPEPSIGDLNTFGVALVALILYVRNRRLSSDNS